MYIYIGYSVLFFIYLHYLLLIFIYKYLFLFIITNSTLTIDTDIPARSPHYRRSIAVVSPVSPVPPAISRADAQTPPAACSRHVTTL